MFMKKLLVIIFIFIIFFIIFSCDLKNFFEQPSVDIEGVSLTELPNEWTNLDVEVIITNNDDREGNIGEIAYQAVIEGIESEEMTYNLDETIPVDTPLGTTIPLKITTEGASFLLSKLEKGKSLNYTVTGTFHEVDRNLDLPLDIEGTALVEIGYEEYFAQPEVTVNEVTGTYTINGYTSYTFDLIVDCDVKNMAPYAATIDEVVYTVYLEGVPSEEEIYLPDPDIAISANGEAGDLVNLNLPVEFNTGVTDGMAIASGASDDGQVEYVVEGTFHALTEINNEAMDFYLPLYVTGETSANIVQQ